MTTEIDLTSLKWTKNVNYPDSTTRWAYQPNEIHYRFLVPEFKLHWKNGQEQNAKKPQKGDMILIRQRTRVTHLVKVLDDYPEIGKNGDYSIYRRVQVLWVAQEPWDSAPHQNDVFGFDVDLQSGKVMDLENIKDLTSQFNPHGGMTAFQAQVAQSLGLGK
jgi:hypothetical protein